MTTETKQSPAEVAEIKKKIEYAWNHSMTRHEFMKAIDPILDALTEECKQFHAMAAYIIDGTAFANKLSEQYGLNTGKRNERWISWLLEADQRYRQGKP